MESLNLEDILTDRESDDDLLEVPLSRRVFRAFFLAAAFIACVLAGFLLYTGVFQHDFYSKRAMSNITREVVQRAPRGVVTDRFGKTLVRNESTFNVYIVPKDLPTDARMRWEIVRAVAIAFQIDPDQLVTKLQTRDWRYTDKVFVGNALSHDALVELSSKTLPGVLLESGFRRVSEVPFVFSHVTGYAGLVNRNDLEQRLDLHIDDEVGRTGVEAYYDSVLRGVHGKEVIIRNSRGEIEDRRIQSQPLEGKRLSLFIDRAFQEYAYGRLLATLHSLQREVGVVIAMNPQNGEILSLFSIPSFDTATVSSYLTAQYNPLFNRSISGTYNPASTIKPLHALAALSEGLILPETRITSPGYIEIANPFRPGEFSRFVDWRPNGATNVFEALARSSNVYFYEIGGGFRDQRGLGIVRLGEWWRLFQLDRVTGIDLPLEASGFLPTVEWKQSEKKQPWRIGDTYNVSIGQGDLLVTPINLLRYVSAIANGGRLIKPRVAQISEPEVVFDLRPRVGGMISVVQQGMEDAVSEPYGTAHLLSSLPFSVAGKTGSAQIDNNRKVNAFFVGYAPVKNPQIALLVLIENAREGSLNAVPIAYDLFSWYFENRLPR